MLFPAPTLLLLISLVAQALSFPGFHLIRRGDSADAPIPDKIECEDCFSTEQTKATASLAEARGTFYSDFENKTWPAGGGNEYPAVAYYYPQKSIPAQSRWHLLFYRIKDEAVTFNLRDCMSVTEEIEKACRYYGGGDTIAPMDRVKKPLIVGYVAELVTDGEEVSGSAESEDEEDDEDDDADSGEDSDSEAASEKNEKDDVGSEDE